MKKLFKIVELVGDASIKDWLSITVYRRGGEGEETKVYAHGSHQVQETTPEQVARLLAYLREEINDLAQTVTKSLAMGDEERAKWFWMKVEEEAAKLRETRKVVEDGTEQRVVVRDRLSTTTQIPEAQQCRYCKGTGHKLYHGECPHCNGTGTVSGGPATHPAPGGRRF